MYQRSSRSNGMSRVAKIFRSFEAERQVRRPPVQLQTPPIMVSSPNTDTSWSQMPKMYNVSVCKSTFISAGLRSKTRYVRPIQTYGKQGCRKKTLKSSEIRQHAAIYDDTFAKPWYHRDEPIASMRPAIPMRLVNGQKLNKWSRIRFDSPCTVPHNYKILEIGWVHKSHQSSILAYMFEFVQSKMIST